VAAAAVAAAALLASVPAPAQDTDDPALRLKEAIEDQPTRPPGLDTALLFTNLGRAPAKVSMKAYYANGDLAGSKDLEVPGNGLAYVFASELHSDTADRRLLGKVVAVGRGELTGTAVLVGGPVTDLPAIVNVRRYNATLSPAVVPEVITHITFPVVAAF
jgi:hypothetical protein